MVSVSPQDGRRLDEIRLPAPAFLPPVVAGQQLFVLTDDGTVTAFR